MTEIDIRIEGRAGRITLNRPKALNALTYDMVTAIEGALDVWWDNTDIDLLIIDAVGDKAFCAGGDIAEMYRSGVEKRLDYGRQFWRDEYRMNAKLAEFPKPVVSFLQGFTMGGGVGVGCHASHRITCENSVIAMPEVTIGLVPDVGGSLILAHAPGRLGEYLGTTGARMNAGDAIFAGFADYFIPVTHWKKLKILLVETGDWTVIDVATQSAPTSALAALQPEINAHFGGERMGDIIRSLRHETTEFTDNALKMLEKNAPLSIACAVEMIHRLREKENIRTALELEYRFTYRAVEHSDFIEGIRAAIIDKDRSPNWQHGLDDMIMGHVVKMLSPLGDEKLTFTKD